MQRRIIISLLVMSFYTPWSLAADSTIDMQNITTQAQFKGLVKDLGAALSYKPLSSAEPLGIVGFDIGLEVSGTKLETDGLDVATGGDAPSTLIVPKLHLQKGLPFGIDIGLFLTSIPSSNIKATGVDIKYAIIEGGALIPALAIRGTYTKLSGVDDLSLNSKGIELSISKGFAIITPYAGIGKVKVSGDAGNVTGIESEDATLSKQFLGANINFGLMDVAAETEKTGDNTTTSIKFGFRF